MSTFLKVLKAVNADTDARRRAEETLRAEYEEFKARAQAAEEECLRLRREIEDVGACLRKVLNEIRQPGGAVAPSTADAAPAQRFEA